MNKIILCYLPILFFAIVANSQANINWIWQNTTNSVQKDIGYKNGFLYSVGNTSNGVFISKMDTLGNIIWVNNYTGMASLENLTIDTSGAVYAVGAFSSSITIGSYVLTSNGAKDILMIKCDNNGNVVLAKNTGGSSMDAGVDIAIDYINNIYVIANSGQFSFAGTTSSQYIRLAILKYNNLGNEVWFNWLNSVPNPLAPPVSATATAIKYSEIDSTIVFSGLFNKGSLQYSIYPIWTHIHNFNSDGYYNGFIVKIGINGSWKNLQTFEEYCKNIRVSDIAIHENGDIYYALTKRFSLSGKLYNYWGVLSFNGTNDILITSLNSTGTWESANFCGSYNLGHTQKIYYNNNTLYGLLYQPGLDCCNFNCSDYYALKVNTTNYAMTYVALDPTLDYYGIAGYNQSFYLGSNIGIGKSCEIACPTNFSLNPAYDKTYCSNPILIGNPECYYVKGGTPTYTYTWSPSTGLNATNIPQPTVSGITSNMVYTLTVTDQLANVIYDTINVSIGIPTLGQTVIDTVCDSQLPYFWNGQFYYYAGSYTNILQNSSGCDSVSTLNLFVDSSSTSSSSLSICSNQLPYSWNGLSISTSGIHTFTTSNAVGCDSTATLNLTIDSISTSSSSLSICSNQLPYSWNGLSISTSGIHTFTTSNAVGCDSTATLNLTIDSISTSSSSLSICSNQLPYSWNGLSISTSGIHTFTTSNAVGCDSTATLNLTIDSVSTSSNSLSICSNQLPYSWNGLSINTSGIHTFTTSNAVGCDSIATLNVSIDSISTSSSSLSICSNQLPYSWNGLSISTSGIHTFTTSNTVGCDSIATLNVSIDSISTSSSSLSICSNQLPYSWNGLSISTSGIHTFTTSNTVGCDSIATLNVSIDSINTSSSSLSICSNQLPYSWNGLSISTSGIHTFTTSNAVGCDSTATLNLSIDSLSLIPPPDIIQNNLILSITNIAGASYEWYFNGTPISNNDSITVTQNGIYIIVVTFATGCIGTDTFTFTTPALHDIDVPNSIYIYPNPTDNNLRIVYVLEKSSNISIKLLGITGQVVSNIISNENQAKGNHKIIINLKSLLISNGVYMLQLSDGISKWNQRIVYRD